MQIEINPNPARNQSSEPINDYDDDQDYERLNFQFTRRLIRVSSADNFMNTESFLKQRLLCITSLDRADDAVPLAEALLAGGLNVMEITFRTAAAAESIPRIRQEVPQMAIGAGTLLTAEQVQQARWMPARNSAFRRA